MKQQRPPILIGILLLFFGVLAGCKKNINLQDVNGSAEVKTNIATPLVTINATMAEIFGIDATNQDGKSKKVNKLYAKLNSDDEQLPGDIPYGTLYYRDTFDIVRDFHPVKIDGYFRPVDINFNVYEQTARLLNLPYDDWEEYLDIPVIIPANIDVPLKFDMPIKFIGINSDDTYNRIDSMIISQAKFRSRIETTFGLTDGELRNVYLTISDQFTKDGKPLGTVEISPANVQNEDIVLDFSNFYISLQDGGATKNNRRAHMLDSLIFTLQFDIHTTREHVLQRSSRIHYTFLVELLEYEALFGYFEPSTFMEDSDIQDMAAEWEGWRDIQQLQMRFMYPTIRLVAEHQIGTASDFPLNVNVKGIWVASKNEDGSLGEKAYAMFGENGTSRTTVWELYEPQLDFDGSSRVDPITDPFDKYAHNEYIVGYTGFDPNTHRGDVDKLFALKPDVIGYDYFITVGKVNDPAAYETQARLVNNTDIRLQAVTVVPFVCDSGSAIQFTDTIDADLSNLNLDSIARKQDWLDTIVDGNAYVYFYAENQIPFDLHVSYQLLDGDNQVIELPLLSETENSFTSSYETFIAAPEYDSKGQKVIKNGEGTIILRVTRDDFDKLSQVRKIRLSVALDDNPRNAVIRLDSELNVSVGVVSSLHAIVNLNK